MEKKSNYQGVKLPGHPVRTGQARGPFDPALCGTHGPEYVEWVSQARSGERDASGEGRVGGNFKYFWEDLMDSIKNTVFLTRK